MATDRYLTAVARSNTRCGLSAARHDPSALDIVRIAPGHGHPIDTPHEEARRLIAHRLKREQKVIVAFGANNPATLDELLPVVYSDTPERLHRVARRSLHAHLLKLEREARVERQGERWMLPRKG